jgi:AmmeMemoRadiSam system protein A
VSPELSAEERSLLLRAARGAIAARLLGEPAPEPAVSPRLREPSGAFVTLRRLDGELRGCVGLIEPRYPLVESVARAAQSAAFEDGRFDPVQAGELEQLTVDVSVLSALRPIRPEDVEVGVHGLLIRHAGRSGLLLPQVPLEHGWSRETFLDQTCRKAGLPPGTWRRPEAELLGFTATVIEEAARKRPLTAASRPPRPSPAR